MTDERRPALDRELVHEFVLKAHGDLAILDAHPEMRDAKGPHGIPLLVHAQKGGVDARGVVELLEAAPTPAG